MNKYGKIIHDLRMEYKMTEQELADRCFLTKGDIYLVENGKMELSAYDLTIMANALGISSLALAEGELIRKEELPKLEDVLSRIEKKIQELEINMYYMQAVVNEFRETPEKGYIDLEDMEERLLGEVDNPYEIAEPVNDEKGIEENDADKKAGKEIPGVDNAAEGKPSDADKSKEDDEPDHGAEYEEFEMEQGISI